MFDLINGIPVHPLVVHAIVVLLPLATLGTLAIALRPRWRRPYGPLVVAAAAVAAVLSPVATESGEALERHVGDPGAHAELGESLVYFAIALALAAAALVWLDRRESAAGRATSAGTGPDGRSGQTAWKGQAGGSRLVSLVTAVAVVVALASAVQVYRVGDSGARAAWGDAATQSGRP